MFAQFSRRVKKMVFAALLFASLLLLGGCGSTVNSSDDASSAASSSLGDATSGAAASGAATDIISREVVIGTMITEDFLPIWVAQRDGLFDAQGIKVRIEAFQSAQELSTAMAAGAIDLCMTDPMVAAALQAGGTPVTLQWVTLGATPEQGRFGIMTSPESGINTLQDLANKPIGVGSNTILEYVMDKLMESAGVPTDQIISEEIKKIPVRYEMMTSNQVAAAALPNSLLVLGEGSGMVLVADDAHDANGENLSQSVMVSRNEFTKSDDGAVALPIIQEVWDEACALVNANPAAYRELLAEKTLAALPQSVQDAYPVPTYPAAARPTATMIEPVLSWMLSKGYLTEKLSYNPATGTFVSAMSPVP